MSTNTQDQSAGQLPVPPASLDLSRSLYDALGVTQGATAQQMEDAYWRIAEANEEAYQRDPQNTQAANNLKDAMIARDLLVTKGMRLVYQDYGGGSGDPDKERAARIKIGDSRFASSVDTFEQPIRDIKVSRNDAYLAQVPRNEGNGSTRSSSTPSAPPRKQTGASVALLEPPADTARTRDLEELFANSSAAADPAPVSEDVTVSSNPPEAAIPGAENKHAAETAVSQPEGQHGKIGYGSLAVSQMMVIRKLTEELAEFSREHRINVPELDESSMLRIAMLIKESRYDISPLVNSWLRKIKTDEPITAAEHMLFDTQHSYRRSNKGFGLIDRFDNVINVRDRLAAAPASELKEEHTFAGGAVVQVPSDSLIKAMSQDVTHQAGLVANAEIERLLQNGVLQLDNSNGKGALSLGPNCNSTLLAYPETMLYKSADDLQSPRSGGAWREIGEFIGNVSADLASSFKTDPTFIRASDGKTTVAGFREAQWKSLAARHEDELNAFMGLESNQVRRSPPVITEPLLPKGNAEAIIPSELLVRLANYSQYRADNVQPIRKNGSLTQLPLELQHFSETGTLSAFPLLPAQETAAALRQLAHAHPDGISAEQFFREMRQIEDKQVIAWTDANVFLNSFFTYGDPTAILSPIMAEAVKSVGHKIDINSGISAKAFTRDFYFQADWKVDLLKKIQAIDDMEVGALRERVKEGLSNTLTQFVEETILKKVDATLRQYYSGDTVDFNGMRLLAQLMDHPDFKEKVTALVKNTGREYTDALKADKERGDRICPPRRARPLPIRTAVVLPDGDYRKEFDAAREIGCHAMEAGAMRLSKQTEDKLAAESTSILKQAIEKQKTYPS